MLLRKITVEVPIHTEDGSILRVILLWKPEEEVTFDDTFAEDDEPSSRKASSVKNKKTKQATSSDGGYRSTTKENIGISQEKRSSANKLQGVARGMKARKEAKARTTATVKIQADSRRKMARTKVTKKRERTQATGVAGVQEKASEVQRKAKAKSKLEYKPSSKADLGPWEDGKSGSRGGTDTKVSAGETSAPEPLISEPASPASKPAYSGFVPSPAALSTPLSPFPQTDPGIPVYTHFIPRSISAIDANCPADKVLEGVQMPKSASLPRLEYAPSHSPYVHVPWMERIALRKTAIQVGTGSLRRARPRLPPLHPGTSPEGSKVSESKADATMNGQKHRSPPWKPGGRTAGAAKLESLTSSRSRMSLASVDETTVVRMRGSASAVWGKSGVAASPWIDVHSHLLGNGHRGAQDSTASRRRARHALTYAPQQGQRRALVQAVLTSY